MKYVYTGGPYTQFMGRDFAFGKPTDITDKATLEAIGRRDDFKVYTEAKQVEQPAPEPRKTLSLSKLRR